MNDYTKGMETLTQLLGAGQAEKVVARFRELSPAFENEAISSVFGRTWSRVAITPHTRSLCIISILAARVRQIYRLEREAQHSQ